MVTKIDASAVYVCLAGFVSPLGTYMTNQRVRATDPAVAANPRYFIADGGTTEEYRDAMRALDAPLPPKDPSRTTASGTPIILGRDPTAEDYVVCTKAIGPIAATGVGYVVASVGQLVPKTAPIVKQYKSHFRPARPEEVPERH